MDNKIDIAILGGGPAGLASGYYARKKGIAFRIYEASSHIGGNCRTFQEGDFFFDSGAHRFHDRDPEITVEVSRLLGDDLLRVTKPSKISYEHRYLDFPLSPVNLLKSLGPAIAFKAGFEIVASRLTRDGASDNFRDLVCRKYGKTLSGMFLLNHTEKLWGLPAEVLSPVIAGQRLKGLSVRTVLSEALSRTPKGGSHMEGNFYYPAKGFGSLPEKLGELCGAENIRRNAKITSVRHDGQAVTQLLVNGDEACRSDVVVSTLPVHLLLRMLDPLPPRSVMERAGRIHFRNLVLAAFFVDKENLTDAASVYFPQKEIPFTRIYEPKHRSRAMSPPGKTSLMVELPCGESDAVWNQDDRGITELVFRHLNHLGWIDKKDVIATAVKRIRYAYPVFDREYQENIEPALRFLDSLKNLRVIGRNGRFVYTWFHNAMRFGKDTIDELCLPPEGEA